MALATERSAVIRQDCTGLLLDNMNSKAIDLNEVIASQDKVLRRVLGEAILLEYHKSIGPAQLEGDETMVGQVLQGLLENARASLPGGGVVNIAVESIEVDDIHARIQPGARRGDFVRLTVSDNSTGVLAEGLQQLFAELPLPNAPRQGNALPLPLIAGIVKRRRGWIEAHSHSGGGALIHVYFPAVTATSRPSPAADWNTETILLVDDEVAIRRMVKSVLERASYDVVEAETGVHALSIWEEHKERVNLLLTDMVMPDGLTGRGLAQRLIAGKPDLKVIYTSGFDLDEEAQRDTAAGTARFLHKPYDMRRLLETVHVAMNTDTGLVRSAPNPPFK